MKLFAEFLDDISLVRDENARILCLKRYLKSEYQENKDDSLRLLLGYYPKKVIKSHELKLWASELTGYPKWLIDRSVNEVGNFIKGLALLLNSNQSEKINLSIGDWLLKISALVNGTEIEAKHFIKYHLCQATTSQRELILKLLSGTFKTPVSRKELVMVLSQLLNLDPSIVSLRLDACCDFGTITMTYLCKKLVHENLKIPSNFPKIIAIAEPSKIAEEHKLWNTFGHCEGIEAQLIKYGSAVYLWTRESEIITQKFPEIISECKNVNADFVLYGKIVPKSNTQPLIGLKSRLDKKTPTKKELTNIKAVFVIWDILRYGNENPSDKTRLEEELVKLANIEFSKNIPFSSWDELETIHQKCRQNGFSGIILHNIGETGQYYFWKAKSYAIKAILMHVELDNLGISGIRAITFGVFRNEEIVPIAKITPDPNLFKTKEIIEFIKENTIEKFGPVRTVKPLWVFELYFDSISLSSRRKSGVVLANPTIHRKIGENTNLADSLDLLKALL